MGTDFEKFKACGAGFYRDLIMEHAKRCSKLHLELYIQIVEGFYEGEIAMLDYGNTVLWVQCRSLPDLLVELLDDVSAEMRTHKEESSNGGNESSCPCSFCLMKHMLEEEEREGQDGDEEEA